MCTLTIHRTNERLLITMNRDEAITRAPERPPQKMRYDHRDVEWLAPLDGEAGGTWIGTNNHRVHACLLNQYLPSDTASFSDHAPRPSRGRIIVDLLAQGHEGAVQQWLQNNFDPSPFPSFLLIVVHTHHTHSFSWDGQNFHIGTHEGEWLMFSSSSWRTSDVLEYRRREFEAWLGRGAPHFGPIPAFHLLLPDGREAWAPLMQREYSATRSLTQIETSSTARETEMRHWSRQDLEHLEWPPRKIQLTNIHDSMRKTP
jgi:hypothetical protein